MKTFLIFIIAFSSFLVFATKPTPPKQSSLSYKSLPCKQKILPLKVDYDVKDGVIFIRLTSEDDIKNFTVNGVRGLDGLEVIHSKLPPREDFPKESIIEFEVSFTKPDGLTYLTLDLQGETNHKTKKQSLPIPVGEISKNQKSLRTENIRTMPTGLKKKTPQRINSSKEEKFNLMNLE